jgi:ABC-2 type transport system permease protein
MRVYFLEAKYEFLKLLRQPAYSGGIILFPLMFYVLFGLALRSKASGFDISSYLIATYGTFGVVASSLFGLGIGVAVERGYGWLQVKRATPMPPAAYLFAKIAMSIVFGLIVVLALFTLGYLFGGVRFPLMVWPELAGTLALGTIPFCAMGLAIGCLASPTSAQPIVNLIYLPMSFLSGLWIPIEGLPGALQHFAPVLPAYHLGQLALTIIGAGNGGSAVVHVAALAGYTMLFIMIAAWGYRRNNA